MKTVLATPCLLEGDDPLGNNRFFRNMRYLRYYTQIRKELEFSFFALFDNASPQNLIDRMLQSVSGVSLCRFDDRMERGPGPHDYPYCWRALYAYDQLITGGIEKIITIDSDGFVLTKRMAEYIRNCNSGWVSFWCENGQHPDSSIHILNKDAFSLYQSYIRTPWQERLGTMMEHDLPFTHVEKQFRCSKFGELGTPEQDETMDYYGQATLAVPLEFGKFA